MKSIAVLCVLAGAVLGATWWITRRMRANSEYDERSWVVNHARRAWK